MEELRTVLREHAKRYPCMEPQDGVKLVFQNEFGGGHLVTDEAASLVRLQQEAAAVPKDERPRFEKLGNGLVRVELSAAGEGSYPLERLNRDFIRSAALHRGSQAGFLAKLALLRELAGAGELPFTGPALEEYLRGYLAAGCPPVSHSGAYRAAYHPAYRVVLSRISLPLLVEELCRRAGAGERPIVAIDGRCASGKTTLAGALEARYGWQVVHLDHFFLRPEQRTARRYAVPGENVDHERFLEQVLLPMSRGEGAEYRPFDCHTQRLGEPVRVERGAVTLVEGSYACHRALWEHYHLRVFLTVEPEEQERRLLAREGAGRLKEFREKWIPLEETYFSASGVEARCDYCLEL